MRATIFHWASGILLAVGVGCTSAPPADRAGPAADRQGVDLPATYGGTLPCASCPGIAWTVTLLGDGTYRLRQIYREAENGEDRAHVVLGRWDTDGRDDRLVLRSPGRDPLRFAVVGAATLELRDRQGRPIDSQLDYRLRRQATVDRIDEMFPMRGEYVYMADAGLFAPCGTRHALPVAQEADNAALERAYLQAAARPASPVLVTFDGRFAMRPKMEGDGLNEVVIVEAFAGAWPGERCDGAVDPAPLIGTHWRLTALPGDGAGPVDPELRAHLVLEAGGGGANEENRAHGSSGCNRFTGSFALTGYALTFGPLAGTRMACPEPAMALESRFHAALAATTGYGIEGETLTLTGPEGPVARFLRYLE